MNRESGFTLIELVMVIVILGILAATALPKFIDTTGEARTAAVAGIVGGLGSSNAVNFAGSLAKGQVVGVTIGSATATTGITDTTGGCSNAVAGNLVDGVSFNTAGGGTYDVTTSSGSITVIGDTVTCLVTSNDDGTKTGTFVLTATK